MLVNPFVDLSESHEECEPEFFIRPSYAPVTQTFFDISNKNVNDSAILSQVLPKTSNSVIINNLNYKSDKMSVKNLLRPFGEIFSIMLNNSRGFAIATFFDSRSAEHFIKETDGITFGQRRLKCDLFFNRNSHLDKKSLRCSPIVILKAVNKNTVSIQKDDIINFVFEKFGEYRQIIDCKDGNFIVEFHDFRNAQNLVQNNQEIMVSQEVFKPSCILDIIKVINQLQNEQIFINKHEFLQPTFIY